MKALSSGGVVLLTAVVATLVLPSPARASLGADEASIEADRAEMQGERRVIEEAEYSVHELQSATGTTVREFVALDGKVFGIAWHGPFVPNLRQLLGPYFEAFRRAAQDPKSRRPGHGPLMVALPGLVVESGGHMRAFVGRAYLPQVVPLSAARAGIR